MAESAKRAKKRRIINTIYEAFTKYKQCLVVKLENVSSNQIQQARLSLRQAKKGFMVVGKNTVIKKAIALRSKEPTESDGDFDLRKPLYTEVNNLDKVSGLLKGKIGLIFSDSPVFDLKPLIESNRKPAAAKVGMVAPLDVTIPPGPTGMDPSQIAFFHALNMSTKIQKGQIEISKEFKVCTAGKKVENSAAVLLQKLSIKPFAYGMQILWVWDNGTLLAPEIFNMNPTDILNKFKGVASKMAAVSLAIGQPNQLSLPHMVLNTFKNIASIALSTGLKFKQLDSLTSGGGSAAPAKSGKADAPKKAEEKKVEKVDEPEPAGVDLGGMFDDF
jgi:large subunit ribosomal protein LP0